MENINTIEDEKLNALIEAKIAKFTLRQRAISANICPECGSDLIQENYEKYDPPIIKIVGFLWGKKEKTILGYNWDNRIVCPKDKSHYEKVETYDDEYDPNN